MNPSLQSDSQVIAKALNSYLKNGHDQELKDILVDPITKKTVFSQKPGWKVFFVFLKPTSLGIDGITYEVDQDGEVSLFESM